MVALVLAVPFVFTVVSQAAPIYIEPGPVQKSVLYADGKEIDVQTQTVWRPVCGSDISKVTVDDLRQAAQAAAAAAAAHPGPGPGGVAGVPGNFNMVFNITSSLPPGALEALAEVEAYIEGQFSDPITVTVNFSFAALAPGILGQTGSNYVLATWPNARAGLQAGMDPSDTIQNSFPTTATIPVRYNGNSATVTDEDFIYFTRANYNATIGSSSGSAATIQFSSNYPWDYTPQDGIDSGMHCFQSVIVHEVGHALGFVSGADGRPSDIEALDIYRFQRSDGAADYNPDTLAEFGTTPRLSDINAPGTDDDSNSDLITVEYQMADGNPNQASHFRAMNPGIYIMDPSLSSGETFYPNFYRSGDLNMFDAIGYDYPPTHTTCLGAWELACNTQRGFDNASVSNVPSPPYSCGSGTAHEGTLWYKFTASATSASISTCGSAAQDSTLAVYSGPCGALVEIACSENSSCAPTSLASLCVSGLIIGETYYVQMSARTTADRGVYNLQIGCSCYGSCCLSPPGGCTNLRENECDQYGGVWAGPITVCTGDSNGEGRDDTCEFDQVKFSQLPVEDGEDLASNLEWSDLASNQALSDDFTSDGRAIRGVRWWGSELDPAVQPDGWFISFFEPLALAQPAATPLGLYFCAKENVTASAETPIPVCDPPHAAIEYEAALGDCCLLHAGTDSRSSAVPAEPTAFFEELCFDYVIGIQAVVGIRYDQPGCTQTLTATTANGDFWGWHSTDNSLGAHEVYAAAASKPGSDWLFGPWSTASHACAFEDMAFALITTDVDGGTDTFLWHNGVPNDRDYFYSQSGGQNPDWMTVDDVNFPSGATLPGVRWITEDEAAFTWTGRVRLEVYANAGGAPPTGSPGTLLTGMWVPDGGGTVTRVALGAGEFYPRYRYDITGLNLALPSGVSWIGVAPEGGTPTGRTHWTTSHTTSPPASLLFYGNEAYVKAPSAGINSFQTWSSLIGGRKSDMAFQIPIPIFADCNCNTIDDDLDVLNGPSLDCNTNGVPDECEFDCNGNGTPDDCDITACSGDLACVDCNNNGSPDGCDLFYGYSVDVNGNSIPDECCQPVDAPLAEPAGISKNRFISLQGGNTGKTTAVRVKMVSLQHPNPPNVPEQPPIDFSAFEGQYRWLGPPIDYIEDLDPGITFRASRLQCAPYYADWSTFGTVHVWGPEVIPSSLYHAQEISQTCNINSGELSYSAALVLQTARWGDVVAPFNPPATTQQPDTTDISQVVYKFKKLPGAPKKVYSLLEPAVLTPGAELDVSDIVAVVDAFKSFRYPYTGIVNCP